jgi:1-acyl-sn-glycerol-3-phosphate acyltransferase
MIVGATLALGLLAILLTLLDRKSNATLRLAKVWSRWILSAIGVRPEYEGLPNLTAVPHCVYVANHQSMVDLWALFPVLPENVRFVAKRELFRIPVLGWALSLSGFVPIERRRRDAAIRSLGEVSRQVRAGRPFVLFAEGTRSRDGKLGPFKKGAFHVALETGVPVVPLAISGAWSVMRPRSLRVTPGPVRVVVGAPMDVAPFLPDDVDGLRAAVRREIELGMA